MKIQTLAAAPLANLFLILTLFLFIGMTPKGLMVYTVSCEHVSDGATYGYYLVLRVQADGTLKINFDPIARNHLAARLRDIYRGQSEKIMYFSADPNASFQSVADALDIAETQVDFVGVFTPVKNRKPGCVLFLPGELNSYIQKPEPRIKMQTMPLWPW